jgi:hypothetical protein
MGYDISGEFIEACDCYSDCPCWAGGHPHSGHCTGLIAWSLGDGSRMDGVDVAGHRVVAVSAQSGGRHGGDASTAIFVDRGASAEQADLLACAFAGDIDGPLADLAAVSGAIRARRQADITISRDSTGWRVTVRGDDTSPAQDVVDAAGNNLPRTGCRGR